MAPMSDSPAALRLPLRQVLLCGDLIVTLSMGIRHGFGLWLGPMTMAHGWTREDFALALAVQNLAWGLAGPIVGYWADVYGARRVLIVGALCYAVGLVGMALATTPMGFLLGAGLIVGVAQAGTTYSVVYGVIGRQVPAEQRSWAMGMAAAAGSFGQFFMVPVENALIVNLGWQQALLVLSGAALLIVPLAFGLREPRQPQGTVQPPPHLGQTLRAALAVPSFRWLTLGYFVCGFQVVFIAVHMPAYLKDKGLPPTVAATSLALIGLLNVFGTYLAGTLGQRLPRRHILSFIYAARSLAIVIFLAVPLSATSVYVFSAVIGFLWLSTVPPTNAIVAHIFGVRTMSTLGGVVFLGHQVGSFMGVWLGGVLYDATGSYTVVWWLAVALGVMAALVNQPVREEPLHREAVAA